MDAGSGRAPRIGRSRSQARPVSGRGKWFITCADLAGRWIYDPAEGVLKLEASSPENRNLYPRYGFVELARIDFPTVRR